MEGNGGGMQDSTEQRVYVNNMNTLHATTSLPARTPYRLRERNTVAPGSSAADHVGSPVASTNSPHSRQGRYRASGRPQQSRQAPSAFAESQNSAAQPHDVAPLTANGEVIHTNLHDIYKRIMRRLQRQLNYEEVSRATLAEQYGVDLQLAYEHDAQEMKAAEAGSQRNTKHLCRTSPPQHPTSVSSSSTIQVPGEGETSTVRRTSPRLSTGCPANALHTRAPEHHSLGPRDNSTAAAHPGGRSSSRLVQFNANSRSFPSGAVGGIEDQATEEESKLEQDIAAQPCPLPLRLVVQHVLDTLQKKMSLAEGGSLKDCIVFSFESRALLDRLLKEIPLYSQYSASQDTAAVTGGTQQDMALVYQKLRQKPVLLPRAGYVEDPVTGAIHGQIFRGDAATSDLVPSLVPMATAKAPVSLPFINASRNSNAGGATPLDTFTYSTSMISDVQLPPGYGKSSRLNDMMLQGGTTAGYGDEQPQNQVLRDHMRVGSAAGGRSPVSISDATSAQNSGTAMESDGASTAPQSSFEAAHRATLLVSVGTVTEENNVTMVPKADYTALHQRMVELEVQLAEAQMHRSDLAHQLCEEVHYTDKKKRVIQYLRETLVRECAMLRSQLHLASGRMQALQQQQHAPPQHSRGVATPSVANDAHNEVLNVSIPNGATRSCKQLGMSMASAMTISLSGEGYGQPPHRYSKRPSHSMSGNESTASISGGANGCGRGRLTTMRRRLNSGCASPGASLSVAPPAVGASWTGVSSLPVPGGCSATGTTVDSQQPNDLEAVQSLLDLVLLAVEENAVLPSQTLQMVRSGHADVETVRNTLCMGEKQQLEELRHKYEERQHTVKKSIIARTAEHNALIKEQKKEVQRLQALTDTTRMRAILGQHLSDLRMELKHMRMFITEQLHFFNVVMENTTQSLLRRSALVDKTLSENLVLTNLVSATRDMIASAGTLLMPMLTNEYRCGYHPWPLKMRNTADPLAHIIHLRYGSGVVVRLRDSLNVLAQLYGALHRCILKQVVLPDSARPSAGKPLQHLCAALALNPMSHTDIVFAARHAYDTEMQLCKQLARYNIRIMWNAYLQRVYTNRSVAALSEAGLSPRLSALPVAGRINVLAKERAALLQERVKVQRARAENAKSTYRLWQEKEIDIMEGYPTPQTQRNQLALLASDTASGSSAMSIGIGGAMPRHSSTTMTENFSRRFGRPMGSRSEDAGMVAV